MDSRSKDSRSPSAGIGATPSVFLTSAEAALYARLSASTLAKLRMSGEGPEYIKAGAKVLYERTALEAWLHMRCRQSTSELE